MTLKSQQLRPGLHLVNNEHMVGLVKDGEVIASSDLNDCGYLARIFARIDAEEREHAVVAHIGGGLAWLPKMLSGYGYTQVIYELDPDVAGLLASFGLPLSVIAGDWRETLTGLFDIIVYDVDAPLSDQDEQRLKAHLLEGGSLYRLTD